MRAIPPDETLHRTAAMAYAYLWEFTVAADQVAEFEQVYGQAGPWVVLFRRATGFLGTHLLRDQTDPLRFITVDRWRAMSDYDAFRNAYARQYRELDLRCGRLTTRERSLGQYDEADNNAGELSLSKRHLIPASDSSSVFGSACWRNGNPANSVTSRSPVTLGVGFIAE